MDIVNVLLFLCGGGGSVTFVLGKRGTRDPSDRRAVTCSRLGFHFMTVHFEPLPDTRAPGAGDDGAAPLWSSVEETKKMTSYKYKYIQ